MFVCCSVFLSSFILFVHVSLRFSLPFCSQSQLIIISSYDSTCSFSSCIHSPVISPSGSCVISISFLVCLSSLVWLFFIGSIRSSWFSCPSLAPSVAVVHWFPECPPYYIVVNFFYILVCWSKAFIFSWTWILHSIPNKTHCPQLLKECMSDSCRRSFNHSEYHLKQY